MQNAEHIGKLVIVPPAMQDAVRADGSYLITGGLGGLGLLIARQLTQDGARHLILMGRRPPKAHAAAEIQALESLGVEVTVALGDVSDRARIAAILASIEPRHPLRGVVHAAGVLEDRTLNNQDRESFAKVLAPKVLGGWHLHALTRDIPLDFFVLFSSVASLLGSAGQANHAAANAFLDALAHDRRAQGLAALSINWGAWSDIGAAAALVEQMDRKGMGAISPSSGSRIFSQLLHEPHVQIGIVPVDWQRFPTDRPLLRAFHQADGQAPQATVAEALAAASPERRTAMLSAYIEAQVAQILGHHEDRQIDSTDGFRDLGMDSLTSLELRNRLQTALGCQLPPGVVFNHPTVESLTGFLLDDVLGDAPTQPSSAPPPVATTIPGLRHSERRIQVRDGALCLCEWGPEDAPALLCLHGTRDHGGSWEPLAEALHQRLAHGYRIVAPDLRGHGRSEHATSTDRYRVAAFVEDLGDLLAAYRPTPITLVGHSLGTLIATLYAADRPEQIRELVLIEPPLPPRAPRSDAVVPPSPDDPGTAYAHTPIRDLDVAAQRLREITPATTPEAARRMAVRLTIETDDGLVWRWDPRLKAPHQRYFEGLTRDRYVDALSTLPVPVTMIFGDRSGWIRDADRDLIRSIVPQADVHILAGGHNLHLEAASALAEIFAQRAHGTRVAMGAVETHS
ncbi:MAG: alpha/beta fold hydrolase, partial [Pseudomonadota bacterium]